MTEQLLALVVPLLGLIVLYWVIRLAVRHGTIEAHHRLDRQRARSEAQQRPVG